MERRARKWSGFTCKRASEDTSLPRYMKKEEEEDEEGEIAIFYFARRVRKIALYSDLIHSFDWSRRTRWWCLCMIVYLARAIQAFVMYCVNGTSRSSLLIESTDSMIIITTFTAVRSVATYTSLYTYVGARRHIYNYWGANDVEHDIYQEDFVQQYGHLNLTSNTNYIRTNDIVWRQSSTLHSGTIEGW